MKGKKLSKLTEILLIIVFVFCIVGVGLILYWEALDTFDSQEYFDEGYSAGVENATSDYLSRFYQRGLADYIETQLYMYPFNKSDVVSIVQVSEFEYLVSHSVACPDYQPFNDVYNFSFDFSKDGVGWSVIKNG